MARLRIRRNDLVQVISGDATGTRTGSGDARGMRGRVLRVLPARNKLVVEGVAVVRRATRANPRKAQAGGFTEKEMPIDASNVMLVCRNCDRPVRVGVKREAGKRMRYCKKCGQEV